MLWYLATPYTRYPGGHEAAHEMACAAAAQFLSAGIPTFSPIAHSHPITKHMTPAQVIDHDLWVQIDAPMLAACSGLIVVTTRGWRESRGVQHEIDAMTEAGKPVIYWHLGNGVPAEAMRSLLKHNRREP